jgi:hypothetical protein
MWSIVRGYQCFNVCAYPVEEMTLSQTKNRNQPKEGENDDENARQND